MSTSKDLLKKLKKYYERMEQEKLSSKDIDQMVELSKDLYERCVILRYKTIEQKVFEKAGKVAEAPAPPKETVEREIDFGIFEPIAEPHAAEEVVAEPSAEPVDEVKEAPKEEVAVSIEPQPIEYSVEDEGMAEDLELDEDLLEKEEQADDEDNEIVHQSEEEVAVGSKKWMALIEKWGNDAHTGILQPIAELSSSFGLNERLLYCNELFDGDTSAFSDLVSSLDKSDSWSDSVATMAEMAEKEQWDADSETIVEFVRHVKRKHA